MTSVDEAKRKYTQKTTADRWNNGMQGSEQKWKDGIAKFAGVSPGPQTTQQYTAGVSGKGANYEQATNGPAADKWFNNYVKKIQQ